MNKVYKAAVILIVGTILFAGIVSCKNPLISVIDEEVAVAVTPPEVVSIFPENSEENIPITLSTITVTFSKYIDAASVAAATFYITDSSNKVINGSRKTENESITFTPNSNLSVGTVYTVTIDGVKDTDGNIISEIYRWTFTTGIEGDSVRPVISSIEINNGDLWTNENIVNVKVDATDNFGIAQMNISTTGNFTDSGWIPWADSFNVNLPAGEGEKVIYLKLKDGSGLETDGYETAVIGLDTTFPEVAFLSLEGGNTGTKNSLISIDIIGEDEEGGSGISGYRLHSEGTEWSAWADLIDGGISLSDQALTVGTNETETFYVQVRDNALNESAVAASEITYDFTKPSVDSALSNPVPGSSDNRIKTYVKLVFTEEINSSTINSSTVYVTKGTEKISTEVYKLVDDNTAIEFTEFSLGGASYILEQNTAYNMFISGSVADVAGNSFESDYTYSFANDSFIDMTAPEGEIVLDLDDSELNAIAVPVFDLMIKAEDDYNGVRAVKIWGDNSDTANYSTFESEAAWVLYSEDNLTDGADNTPGNEDDIPYMSYDFVYTPPAGGWSLPVSDGDYYIYYKFIDYANNESDSPGRLRVSLDTTDPVLNDLQIDDGSGFSNNINDSINIIIDAEDGQSGLSSMWISIEASNLLNMPGSDSGVWEDWSSLKTDVPLVSGEGKYYIYAEARDFVGNLSTLQDGSGFDVYAAVILDYTSPIVTFGETDFIETNGLTRQNVTITDAHPSASPLSYQVPSGIASYQWEQISGPAGGTITFYDDETGTNADNTVYKPYISVGVSDGTQDGSYEIRVTATDNAGNTAYENVDFIWDTIEPEDMGVLTVYNEDGTALNTSENSTYEFTSSARPYITWAVPSGADFFTAIPASTGIDPNDEPVEQQGEDGWYPHWDDDQVDWSDPATYEDHNYIKTTNPVIFAPVPSSAGSNDGRVYFYVAAWDNAGNRSNESSHEMVEFWIDTLPPVVTKLNDLTPKNSSFTINYENANDSGDGRVFDQRTAFDNTSPPNITDGSGIVSYLWEEIVEPEESPKLTISNADSLDPTISAAPDGSEDGIYDLKLTVTDNAGNIGEGFTFFEWDTIVPSVPAISGIPHTPNVAPSWSWYGTGGGNGSFRYRLERIWRNWESLGGAYSGSSEVVVNWTESAELDFDPSDADYPDFPSPALDDKYEYTLYVQERDVAGNWSAVSSQVIWIDTDFTSEPALNLDGAYLRNSYGTNRQVTWNWSTGLGNPGTERYRYRLLNSSSAEVIGWTTLADDVTTKMIDFATQDGGLSDDVYTFEVEEYNISDSSWVTKVASSNVQIDANAPNIPVMYAYTTGYNVISGDYHLSNDTTPYFRWSSGGEGSGSYRWSFDESNWTYTTSTAIIPAKSQGVYIFYVQERDIAGNWSDSATWKLEIDTTPPALNYIELSNKSTNAVDSTTYTVSRYVDIAVDGSGSNTQTYPDGDIRSMRFWNSGSTSKPYTYVTGSTTTKINWDLLYGTGTSQTDGQKTVFCELRDYAGNISVVVADSSITLDTVKPVVSSFNINNNAATVTNPDITLYSAYSGANYMRISTDGGSSWQGWYSVTTSKAWTLDTSNGYSGYGAKNVIVQFTDLAGMYSRNLTSQEAAHYTEVDDSIFYGQPVVSHAYKGNSASGSINLYYESFPSDTGSNNTYYIYTATSPTGVKTLKTTTTNLSSYSSTYTEGQLYYFFIRVYNPDVDIDGDGIADPEDFSNYSNYEIGFSSDMTVVYDDDDAMDTTLAGMIKNWASRNWVNDYSSYYNQGSYTMPQYTVTLVPEDEVSGTFDVNNIIYGDPVIITPGTSWDYYNVKLRNWYPYSGKIRNIADNNKGIFAMHHAGSRFIYWTSSNWTSWVLGDSWRGVNNYWPYDPRPTDLDLVYSKGYTQYAGTTEYLSKYDYIWHRYIYNDNLYNNYRTDPDREELLFTQPSTTETYAGHPDDPATTTVDEGGAHRYSIYNSGISGVSPNYTYFYADDPDYTNYYTVARQGRFVFWGYDKIPAYVNGGIPFFYNALRFLQVYY